MKDQLKNFSSLLRSKKQLMTCIFLTLIVQITVAIGIIKFDEKHHLLGELTLFKSMTGETLAFEVDIETFTNID